MLMVALPLLRVVAGEVYPPPVSVTEPVGVGLPALQATATVTDRAWFALMLDEPGVTVTVGVTRLTVTPAFPEALA